MVNLRWIRGGSLPSIFGAVFEVHFCTLFGLRSVCDLAILRGFFALEGGFGALFGPLLDRTFHHPEVRVLGGLGRVSRGRGLRLTRGGRCLSGLV